MLEQSSNKQVDDLRWIRIFTPVHIPKYLVEQVRDRDFSVEDFYKFQEITCVKIDESGTRLNPLNHLYILANDENLTKGFLWFTIDPLAKNICIQTFSMDKDYWGKGLAVEHLAAFIKDIRKKADLKKVYWSTNYPKHSERHGFKRSRAVLMEFTGEEDGEKCVARGSRTRREYQSIDTTATAVSGVASGGTESTGDIECDSAILAACNA